MLCTMETTMVRPSRYGLVSRRATYIQQERTEFSLVQSVLLRSVWASLKILHIVETFQSLAHLHRVLVLIGLLVGVLR